MAILRSISRIQSNHFTFDSKSRKFIAEHSDVKLFNPSTRIYDDACDVGFFMISKKTGAKVLFFENGVEKNSENEIEAFKYSANCRENPAHLRDLQVILFND